MSRSSFAKFPSNGVSTIETKQGRIRVNIADCNFNVRENNQFLNRANARSDGAPIDTKLEKLSTSPSEMHFAGTAISTAYQPDSASRARWYAKVPKSAVETLN